jgi:hypothetical protein
MTQRNLEVGMTFIPPEVEMVLDGSDEFGWMRALRVIELIQVL